MWTSYFTHPYPCYHLTVNEFTLNETINATNSGSAGYISLFLFNGYSVVKELWKKNWCKSEATAHKESKTRTLSTTCVFHPQELNTCWIASGKLSAINYLFCSSYVEFLEAFLRYTSTDHVDRKNLTHAIAKFKDLDTLFRQVIKKIISYPLYKVKKELSPPLNTVGGGGQLPRVRGWRRMTFETIVRLNLQLHKCSQTSKI